MKKSTDSSGDSSDERNDAIIEDVFNHYSSSNGRMSRSNFSLVIARLSNHVPELKGIEMKTTEAAFNLFSNGGHYMSIAEFKRWWCSDDRFSYFAGKKSVRLSKAYKLYKKYSTVKSINSSTGNAMTRRMNISEFMKLLEDMKIDNENEKDEFDQLDEDGDGVLSFREFCAWLNWF